MRELEDEGIIVRKRKTKQNTLEKEIEEDGMNQYIIEVPEQDEPKELLQSNHSSKPEIKREIG